MFLQIKKQLQELYFFSNQEMDGFLEKISQLPEDALEKISKILKDGQKKQAHFLKVLEERDPAFPEALEIFLNAQTKVIHSSAKLKK